MSLSAVDGADEECLERRLERIKHYLCHGISAKVLDQLQNLEDTLDCWEREEAATC